MSLELLRAGSFDLAPEKGGALPERLLALRWGDNETVSAGPVRVTDTTARVLPLNQNRSNRKRVAIDFEHSTVEGSKYWQKPPHTLAGYADVEVVPGEGLVFSNVEWLEEGRKRVAHGDYRELSAAVKTNEAGEVVWVHSLALCRHGQVRDLKILSATEFEPVTKNQSQSMDHKKILTAILGLSADAEDSAIEEAAKKFAENRDSEKTKMETLSTTLADLQKTLNEAKPGDATAIVALSQRVEDLEKIQQSVDAEAIKTLKADVDALRQADETRERAAIMAKAIGEGKIVPLHAESLPIEDMRKVIEGLPADQVPLADRTPERVKVLASSGVGSPDSNEAEVRRQLGISEEDWKKYA